MSDIARLAAGFDQHQHSKDLPFRALALSQLIPCFSRDPSQFRTDPVEQVRNVMGRTLYLFSTPWQVEF